MSELDRLRWQSDAGDRSRRRERRVGLNDVQTVNDAAGFLGRGARKEFETLLGHFIDLVAELHSAPWSLLARFWPNPCPKIGHGTLIGDREDLVGDIEGAVVGAPPETATRVRSVV